MAYVLQQLAAAEQHCRNALQLINLARELRGPAQAISLLSAGHRLRVADALIEYAVKDLGA